MGVWLGALGKLRVTPEPDDDLILEYYKFSKHTCPHGYREDEVFPNSWFFDRDNTLISGIGKFAEPSVWYDHIKKYFFEARGYQLEGEPYIVGEFDIDMWLLGELRDKSYKQWLERVKKLMKADIDS